MLDDDLLINCCAGTGYLGSIDLVLFLSPAGWLSAAVENTCDLEQGIVVFLSINLVNTPPNVSIPNDNGVTSSNNTSLTSPVNTPP
jgi:hypothetical protein